MLDRIITWSLTHRLMVILLAVALALTGLYSLSRLDIDAFPDTTPVQVQINTVVASLAPEEVEQQITFPVEQAISGLPGLTDVRSISKFGLSQVVVIFEDGTDISLARSRILERLTTVELPEGLPRPEMGPVSTGLGEVFHYIVTGQGHDLTDLRTIHDWVIKPALRTVAGVAEINSWGGHKKQYQARIDPARLAKHDLSFDAVVEAVQANNLNVGGGNISAAGEMLLVQGIGRVGNADQIADIVITARHGVPIRVGDVAEVVIGSEIRHGAVTANGQGEAMLGLGFMLMGENSHEVTWRLKDKLDEIRRTLPEGVGVQAVYDRTELVDHVIDTVRGNLFEGGLLVVAVLFVFLGNLRAGLIVAGAIPLSMLFAFSGMWRFGIAASLMSLGAIDFGLIVDSAVIQVENVVRHLGAAHDRRRSTIEIVRDAVLEVRKPTMFGELIIMLVYVPILTLEGIEGRMFQPMALTVILALLGSLLLSLTVIPVLASLALPRKIQHREPLIVRAAQWLYAPLLRAVLRYRYSTIAMAIGLVAGAGIVARGLGSEFIPRLSEGAAVVTIARLAGTDLAESIRYNTQMEKAILAGFPDEVRHVWSRIGAPEVATDPMGVELSDIFLSLHPRQQWKQARTQTELVEKIRRHLRDMPGQKIAFSQPIEMRINEMIAGARADVAVKLYGDDFAVLTAKAAEIAAVLGSIQGAADVSTEQVIGQPVLQIVANREQLARYGVPAREVLELVESVGGKELGEVVEDQLRFPLVVRLPDEYRQDEHVIGAIPIATSDGQRIPLSHLADIRKVEGPSTITREWGQRRTMIQANVQGRDVGSFVAEAQRRIAAQVQLPPGRYRIEWGGQFENLQRARTRLMIVVPAVLLMIFVLLYMTYNRLSDALRVFTGVPLACVGGVLALWVREMPFSISAAVGFIALSGVSVLNSMVLVSYVQHLRQGGLSLHEAVRQAALVRLRPVLMTALVASLGFVPMAASTGMGAEVQRPLATVVIGGVLSSTVLTLLVLPALYLVFRRPDGRPVRQDGMIMPLSTGG